MTNDEQKLIQMIRNSPEPSEMIVQISNFIDDFLEKLPTFQKTSSAVPQARD